MRFFACLLSAACGLLSFTGVVSAQTVFLVGESNQFGTINLSNLVYTQTTATIGGAVSQVTNLAFNGSGFYITDRTNTGTNLRTMSFGGIAGPSLGTIRVNGQPDEFIGLALAPGGASLYTMDFSNGYLIRINPSNVATTQLGTDLGYPTEGPLSGKLAYVGSTLFGAVNTTNPNERGLYSFNTATGAATFIGNGGQASLYTDMIAFSSGSNLYGINGRTVYQINTLTGALASLGLITGANVPGSFAAAAIPEPGTFALVAVAAGLALVWRARARRVAPAVG